jgi:hypothetical protein
MVGLAPVHDDPIPHAVLQAYKVLAGAKILPLGALAFLGFWRHGNRLCWMLRFEAGASPRLPGGVVVWFHREQQWDRHRRRGDCCWVTALSSEESGNGDSWCLPGGGLIRKTKHESN